MKAISPPGATSFAASSVSTYVQDEGLVTRTSRRRLGALARPVSRGARSARPGHGDRAPRRLARRAPAHSGAGGPLNREARARSEPAGPPRHMCLTAIGSQQPATGHGECTKSRLAVAASPSSAASAKTDACACARILAQRVRLGAPRVGAMASRSGAGSWKSAE